MSGYVIRETASGIKFDLTAVNGQVILTSEVYNTRAAALKGIASIRRTAPGAPVEDRTAADWQAQPHPRFEMYQDKAGAFRFRLKARNGKIVGVSEGYTGRTGCMSGIDSVRKNAAEAEIEGYRRNEYGTGQGKNRTDRQ